MTALSGLGLLHGNGALPWVPRHVPEFDIGDQVELVIGTDVDIVTVVSQLSRLRYVVRFDQGAELTVQAHHLAKVD